VTNNKIGIGTRIDSPTATRVYVMNLVSDIKGGT
jgi:hypothetical protein